MKATNLLHILAVGCLVGCETYGTCIKEGVDDDICVVNEKKSLCMPLGGKSFHEEKPLAGVIRCKELGFENRGAITEDAFKGDQSVLMFKVPLTEEESLKLVREGKGCRKCDLSRQDLTDLSLEGANLIHANLHGSNLGGVNLSGANLSLTEAISTDFSGAKLVKANLENANLARAKFAGADLTGAVLSGANLNMAQLEGSTMTHVVAEKALCNEQTTLPEGWVCEKVPEPESGLWGYIHKN